jgi:RimJ/RimL family protein N-acetyltransferase
VVRDAGLAAVVVFHDWQADLGTVQLSAAADTPRWATRQVVGAILGAAFLGRLGAPVRRVWTATPSTNERAIRFNQGMGFTKEAVLRHHYAHKVHATICGMMDSEYRRRYGQEA